MVECQFVEHPYTVQGYLFPCICVTCQPETKGGLSLKLKTCIFQCQSLFTIFLKIIVFIGRTKLRRSKLLHTKSKGVY